MSSRRFFTTWQCDLGVFTTEKFTGLEVTDVVPDGFAAETGVAVGDLLLYLDGLPIYTRTDLWPFQVARRPGDRIELEYARDGNRLRGTGTSGAIV